MSFLLDRQKIENLEPVDMHATIKYHRNTVPTKRQFSAIYDRKLYKTKVYTTVFVRPGHCNHRPWWYSSWYFYIPHLFVYSKSENTLESVSMSGRLHDNSSRANPIGMKLCA